MLCCGECVECSKLLECCSKLLLGSVLHRSEASNQMIVLLRYFCIVLYLELPLIVNQGAKGATTNALRMRFFFVHTPHTCVDISEMNIYIYIYPFYF